MLSRTKRWLASAPLALIISVSNMAQALDMESEDLSVAGLSVYTETARDIFIARMHLPEGSPLQNLLVTPPPKAMEYRVATRRLSSRGFSGMILLQAELGSGERAPQEVTGALNVVKRKLKGALKQGDQFVILLNEDDETVFLLNDVEIHRSQSGSVFDYLFAGWVGDGAAATFREPLLSGNPAQAVAARSDQLNPTESRVAMIRGWMAPPPAPVVAPVTAPVAAPAATPASEAVAEAVPTPAEPAIQQVADADAPSPTPEATVAVAEDLLVEVATVEDSAATTAPVAATADVVALAVPEPVPTDPVTEAVFTPTPAPEPVQDVAMAIPVETGLDIDDREYQRQLQEYVHGVMRQVYGEVKYPRRAIKYNWEGKVELIARLDENGDLLEVVVDSSSGHKGLDKAAEAAIMRAAPFPELTPVAREELESEEGDGYIMSIPVTFALRR